MLEKMSNLCAPSAPAGVFVLFLLFLFVGASPVSAELTADQIAILANRNNPESLAVAKHYASIRDVPSAHIIQLDLPAQETISREEYETVLVQPTRRALEERRLAGKIRVLVTTYGIPLRVAAPLPSSHYNLWRKDALDRQQHARRRLDEIEEWLKRVAPPDGAVATPPDNAVADGNTPEPSASAPDPAVQRVTSATREATARLALVQDRQKAEEWTKDLTRITLLVGGTAAIVQGLRPLPTTDPQRAREEKEKLQQQVASAQVMIRLLNEAPSEINRQRAYLLTERVFGLQGVLVLANGELDTFAYKNGDASLDSELSLLWWNPDFYRIAGRLPNPLHYEAQAAADPQAPPPPAPPVLMVSRLDAPTPQLARQLVEQAVKAEQAGLAGKAYVDARGLQPGPPFSYGFYDQSLRDLAEMLRRLTPYEVVLEDTERRFSRPGQAPGVAVYVGWYRLRSYEDAFTFNPGAIGYHIASAEAVSIHDPDEPGWCKNALEHGITATLGSTGEPLLDAFPLPGEFLGLLLTGRYPLVEAYYLTTRYLSWRMVLFGDPLYNPWRGKGVAGGQAWKGGASALPTAPSDRTFTDPIQTMREVKQQRDARMAQLDRLMEQLDQRSREPRR